jgi:hypothetical protein
VHPAAVFCLQVHSILSSVNARLQQAAAAHPTRLQAGPAVPHGSSSGGGGGGTTPAAASLVDLLQQLTESVVGLIEGLAVEKECLESEMLHANDEARQLRGQVRHPLLLRMLWQACVWHSLACNGLPQCCGWALPT